MRALVLLLVVFAFGACGPAVNDQPCFACSDLLEMTVLDADSDEDIDDFVVEVTVNGEVLGEPTNCEVENREGNRCAFGRPAGVYEIIVRAPGYQTHEMVKRVAGEAGAICANACLNTTRFDVKMRRAQ